MQGRRDAQGVEVQRRPPAQLGEVTAGLGFVKGTGIDRARKGADRAPKAKGGACAKSGRRVIAGTSNSSGKLSR